MPGVLKGYGWLWTLPSWEPLVPQMGGREGFTGPPWAVGDPVMDLSPLASGIPSRRWENTCQQF